MALTIQTFASGDTNYISKHNANNSNIKTAIEALQSAISAAGGGDSGAASIAVAYEAIFGGANCLIGYGSYLPSDTATDHLLSVAAGYSYDEPTDTVVTKLSSTTLNFTGQTTGTYYIHVDAYGTPSFSGVSTGGLYSVAYDSVTGDFTSVTRTANLFETATNQESARGNTWAIDYTTLDERLNGAERATFQVLQKTVVATDIALTAQEAFEQAFILLIDGPQTSDVSLTIPSTERIYTVNNDCSETHSVEFIAFGETAGYVLRGKMFAVLYCDGTDVTPMFLLDRASGSASSVDQFIELSDTPSSYLAGDALKLVRVNAAHTALEFVAPSSSSGDVVGPSSAVADSIVAFNSTTGKLIKDAGYAKNDSGSGVNDLWSADKIASEITNSKVFYPSSFYEAAPTSSQVMLHTVAVGAVTLPSGLTASQGYAGTAATAQTDFDIQKNGSSVGTMRFAASGTVASFIAASPITLAAGDRLKVIAPATPDATLAGLTFTLVGART